MKPFSEWLNDLEGSLRGEPQETSLPISEYEGKSEPPSINLNPHEKPLPNWDYETCFYRGMKIILPDGIAPIEGPDGVAHAFEAICCRCGEAREILCDISEIPLHGYDHYCGGSPQCCP